MSVTWVLLKMCPAAHGYTTCPGSGYTRKIHRLRGHSCRRCSFRRTFRTVPGWRRTTDLFRKCNDALDDPLHVGRASLQSGRQMAARSLLRTSQITPRYFSRSLAVMFRMFQNALADKKVRVRFHSKPATRPQAIAQLTRTKSYSASFAFSAAINQAPASLDGDVVNPTHSCGASIKSNPM